MIPSDAPHPLSILIIDDEEVNREILKDRLLEIPGWNLTIDTVGSSRESLSRLKQSFYDLVFLDYRLPDTTELEFLDRIRQLYPKSSVVMVSAYGGERVAVSSLKHGALDYIPREDFLKFDFAGLFLRMAETKNLTDQNMELRQVSQMKTEFLANVSHELRTPLSVIIGYAEMLKRGDLGALSAGQGKAMDTILDRASLLLGTLNQILKASENAENRQTLVLKPLELRQFLDQAVRKGYRDQTRKNMKIEFSSIPQEDWIQADEGKLSEVMDNLLSNAFKFGPDGSSVFLSLKLRDKNAVIGVSDSGQGIAPEMMTRVFELFGAAYQGPVRTHQGLGLGLPFSKEVVEKHGGALWLESPGLGKGCTAFVSLPIASQTAGSSTVPVSSRFEKRRVLVVDDNPDIVELLKLILASASQNIQFSSASSGLDAIESVRNNPPHLIILDVMMPGMNGIEFIGRLRKLPEGKRIPIMVLTGYDRAAGKAREIGADEVLLKPVDRKVFVEKTIGLLKISPPAEPGQPPA